MVLENLNDESSRIKAELRAEMSVAEESRRAEKTRVERLKREIASEAEKRQQFLAERRDTSETGIYQLAEGENFLQGLQSKVVFITEERSEWYYLANEASKKNLKRLQLTWQYSRRFGKLPYKKWILTRRR